MADVHALEVPIHYRSLAILFGYLSLVIFLFLICCKDIYARYQARQKNNDWATKGRRAHFFLFAILSGVCLWMTWFYMISLFFYSYNSWATSSDGLLYSNMDLSLVVRMGLWLKKTYLFQEAWEAVSADQTRFWWSGQIFGWTIGWGVFMGIAARRYRISHAWVYMVIGQFVSISFAANLFFAMIIVSQRPNKKDINFYWSPSLLYELVPVVLSLAGAGAVPFFAYEKDFMFILLIPHILVFVPCLLGPSNSNSSKMTQDQKDKATPRYATLIQWIGATAVIMQAYFTFLMLQDLDPNASFGEVIQWLWDAIYVHPACSSVSWDVILCTTTAFFWALVHGFDSSRMLGSL